MKTAEIYLLIAAMALVTYVPRALPAFLAGKRPLGKRAATFLDLLPYTAMAALIFPGVLAVDAAHPLFGVLGCGAAALLAYANCPLIVSVLAAVGTNCLLYLTL